MHYRNGREAKNGDTVVSLGTGGGGAPQFVGVLTDAVAGNDFCNGNLIYVDPYSGEQLKSLACLCDCLHVDDVAAILAEKGLDKRPEGK